MNEIEQTSLKSAILAAHNKAQGKVESVRADMIDAVDAKLNTAILVGKAQRQYKQTDSLCIFLEDVMSPEETRAYLTLNKIAQKRNALEDKRQLQLAGILDMQSQCDNQVSVKPAKTIHTIITRMGRDFKKKIEQRSPSEWTFEERETFKRDMIPFLEVLEEL